MSIALGLLAAALSAEPANLPFELNGDSKASISWSRQIASPNDDWVNDLTSLRDGRLLAVGFLNRADGSPPSDWAALAAELALDGTLTRQGAYGVGGGIDAFWSMAEAGDGNRMFAGFTTRIGGGGIDALALLTNASGEMLAERAFGGGGYDRFTDLVATGDGFVFVGHSQAAGDEKRRVLLVKTDLEGNPLWQQIHDAPESWGALYIEPVDDGFVIAGGTTIAGDGEMFAMKVDGAGREVWRKRVGTPEWDEVNHGLVVRPDGSIVLAGYTHRRGQEANDFVAATLSSQGDVQRIERFGGGGDDRAILAKADASGRIWIVGQSSSAGAGGSDLLLTSLDKDGMFEGRAITIGGPADDNGTALLPMSDGSILLAGYSRGLGGGGQDAFVLRLARPAWDKSNPAFKREVAKQP